MAGGTLTDGFDARAELPVRRRACSEPGCTERGPYYYADGVDLCGPHFRAWRREAQGASLSASVAPPAPPAGPLVPHPGSDSPHPSLASVGGTDRGTLPGGEGPPSVTPSTPSPEVSMLDSVPAPAPVREAPPPPAPPKTSPPAKRPPAPAEARTSCRWPGCTAAVRAHGLCDRDRYRVEAMGLAYDVNVDEAARSWEQRQKTPRKPGPASPAERAVRELADLLGVKVGRAAGVSAELAAAVVDAAKKAHLEAGDGAGYEKRIADVNGELARAGVDPDDELEEAGAVRELMVQRDRAREERDQARGRIVELQEEQGRLLGKLDVALGILRRGDEMAHELQTIRDYLDAAGSSGAVDAASLWIRMAEADRARLQRVLAKASAAGMEVEAEARGEAEDRAEKAEAMLAEVEKQRDEALMQLREASGPAALARHVEATETFMRQAAGRAIALYLVADDLTALARVRDWKLGGDRGQPAQERVVHHAVGAVLAAGELMYADLQAGDVDAFASSHAQLEALVDVLHTLVDQAEEVEDA